MDGIEIRPQKLAWGASLAGLFFLISALWAGAAANSAAYLPPALAAAVLLILSAVSAGRLLFVRREKVETENLRIYRREHPESELFADSDEAVRLAARANRMYAKYAVPVLTALIGIFVILASMFIWRVWNAVEEPIRVAGALQFSVLGLAFSVLALVAGSYLVGCSRNRAYRWLRPSGAWLFLLAALFFLGGVALLSIHMNVGIPNPDRIAGRIGLILIILLGAELILNVIIEFYRPRHAGEEPYPVYESRLLALFTEPGGIARNVATSLDYQFGFRISEARFYRFVERGLVPFAVLLVVTFWLMTCFEVIEAEENGIRERFGRVVTAREAPLTPGLYVKLPWPFAKIMTFPVAHVQEIPIGYIPAGEGDSHDEMMPPDPGVEMGDTTGRVIVWSKKHHQDETDFVVASEPTVRDFANDTLQSGGKVPVSVYFAAASVPVYFKVRNLYDYAYLHNDAKKTLRHLALRELVAYLASVDLFDILAEKREEGGRILRERIQQATDRAELGVDIVFVGLQGLHPPVTVGQAFDDVVSAMEEKHKIIIEAEQYAVSKVPEAEGKASELAAVAQGYRYNRQQLAQAEAARFDNQLLAYQASPKMFVLRSFLDVLEQETEATRKYVVGTPNGRETVVLDLQEKLRPDLLDINLEGDQNP